ncbi:MAG: hypothetical protein EUB_01556 [Eubacterium sp.]|uniref:DUF6353 family protein n=1 Tax=Eubacterium sp. TaxID=142586 RepID=UPI00305E6E17
MEVKKAFYKSKFYLRHGAPLILSGMVAAGVVATSVLSVRATPKAMRLLEKATEDKGESLTNIEIIRIAGPAYIPALVVGVSTIFGIFGANALNKKQQASVASAYALIDRAYKEYRDKVKELFGGEVDQQVRGEIAKDHYDAVVCPFTDSSEKHLFYEPYSDRYFECTIGEVHDAEYHFNRNYALRGYAELNEFYEFLGLTTTEHGACVGWSDGAGAAFYGYSWIDFDHELVVMEDGLECYVINMPFGPTADFMDY